MDEKDPYSRFEYRKLIAWPARIERESPFLDDVLASAPSRRLLDLGCGTGEHSRYLASKGFSVVGVDLSESMLESCVDEKQTGVEFVLGDISNVAAVVDGFFGSAICLGNTIPHLVSESALRSFVEGVAAVLEPEAPLIIQILNYDRIIENDERFLPINFRPDPDGSGTIVFLRLMDPKPDGSVTFYPASLRLVADRDEPLELIASRRVDLRGWRRDEIELMLREGGFEAIDVFGGFDRSTWERLESRDLLLVARRSRLRSRLNE